MSGKHRKIHAFLKGDGDENTKVRNSGDFHTIITRKERAEVTDDVRRRNIKFLQILVNEFGENLFRRWDLDAGRLGYLIDREIKYAGVGKPDPTQANQLMQLDFKTIQSEFPEVELSR